MKCGDVQITPDRKRIAERGFAIVYHVDTQRARQSAAVRDGQRADDIGSTWINKVRHRKKSVRN